MKAKITKRDDNYELVITNASKELMEEVIVAIARHGSEKKCYMSLINELFNPEDGQPIITQIGF